MAKTGKRRARKNAPSPDNLRPKQLIIERIQREGPITFAEYMRMALYELGYGYYVTGAARIGWEGADYYTSTDISPFFANCMGRQLFQMWEKLGHPTPFIVLEQGAGRGLLAQGVRAWASQEAPDFNAALDYRTEDRHVGQDARVNNIGDPHAVPTRSVGTACGSPILLTLASCPTCMCSVR